MASRVILSSSILKDLDYSGIRRINLSVCTVLIYFSFFFLDSSLQTKISVKSMIKAPDMFLPANHRVSSAHAHSQLLNADEAKRSKLGKIILVGSFVGRNTHNLKSSEGIISSALV